MWSTYNFESNLFVISAGTNMFVLTCYFVHETYFVKSHRHLLFKSLSLFFYLLDVFFSLCYFLSGSSMNCILIIKTICWGGKGLISLLLSIQYYQTNWFYLKRYWILRKALLPNRSDECLIRLAKTFDKNIKTFLRAWAIIKYRI